MPATRRPRHDVVLRVPKAIPSRGGGSSLLRGPEYGLQASSSYPLLNADGSAAAGPSTVRRAHSPVKGLGRGAADGAGAAISQDDSDATLRATEPSTTGLGPSYAYAAQSTSAAEWNSLLIWARRQRGPQWDSATGMWQVDEGSTEYYAFGNDPARHTKLSRAAKRPTRPDESQTMSQAMGMPASLAATAPGSIGGLAASHAPGVGPIQSGEPGSAIPWNTGVSHPSLRGGPAPPGSVLSSHGPGPGHGGFGNGPGAYAGHPHALTPQPGEDSPPPMGPGSRRSRAR